MAEAVSGGPTYQRRFTLIYFALAAIAGAAVAVLLVLGFGDEGSSSSDAAPVIASGWSA